MKTVEKSWIQVATDAMRYVLTEERMPPDVEDAATFLIRLATKKRADAAFSIARWKRDRAGGGEIAARTLSTAQETKDKAGIALSTGVPATFGFFLNRFPDMRDFLEEQREATKAAAPAPAAASGGFFSGIKSFFYGRKGTRTSHRTHPSRMTRHNNRGK